MDNNNFEQQFTQNVKNSVNQNPATNIATTPVGVSGSTYAQPKPTKQSGSNFQLSWVVSGILALALVIESIVLVISLSNYFSIVNDEYIAVEDEDVSEVEYSDAYAYDDNGDLVALDLTCTDENGAIYVFGLANKYEQRGANGNVLNSGNYQIVNGNLVQITTSDNSNKVLYYDGTDVADGVVVYRCAENSAESEE